MNADRKNFYDLGFEDLEQLLSRWDEPGYRASQVWEGVYKQLRTDFNLLPNVPKVLRTRLHDQFSLTNLETQISQDSSDQQTSKTLFRLRDGKAIETVLMRYHKRRTLCISTQSGCALGCVFCATGQMGLQRNLSSGEIVEQVVIFERFLREQGETLTNVVLMGMGEPFHNYDQTLAAIDRMNQPTSLNLGARRFTISTVGLIPQMVRFTQERRQVNLAVSLHAADDELRSSILPINKKYPLADLFDACREYTQLTKRRITFEWALIEGVNDHMDQASKLVELNNGMLSHVNLIPLNPTSGYAGTGSSQIQARQFKSYLEENGIPCTIRVRRGIDIHAGCGQLATRVDIQGGVK